MEDAGHRQAAPAMEEWRALGSELRDDWTVDARGESLCFCGQEVRAPFVYDGDRIDKTDPLYKHISPYASLGFGGVIGSDGTESPVALPAQGHKQPVLGGVGTNPSITRMQVLRIGDLLWAGVPGEPTVTTGRRIEGALDSVPGHGTVYRDVVIAGLANDYDSYYATPEEYAVAQYEGSFTLFGPQSQPLLSQELYDLADRMVAAEPVPVCPGTDIAFCATHMPHPDTSVLSAPVIPIGIDPTPVAVTQPQRNVARFEVAEFSWRGGSPSAEWRPDHDRIEVQRLDGDTWRTAFGDTHGTATVLRFDEVDNEHRWTAQWDVARDVPPGLYRFHIVGAYGAAPGIAAPYTLDSVAFDVTPASGLRIFGSASGSDWKVQAGYPQPDKLRSFRFRQRLVDAGSVVVTVDRGGSTAEVRAPVDPSGVTFVPLEPGDTALSTAVADQFTNTGRA